jgi:acetyl esterase/lipase
MLPISGFLAEPSRYSLVSTLLGEGRLDIRLAQAYGPDARHRLDLYRPNPMHPETVAAALFVHGGSWRHGSRACYGFVGAALAAHGIPTAVADYRLFPEVRWPAFQEDVALAFRWLRRDLRRNGPRPVILIGHSAGAHIAALLATDPQWLGNARPAGLVGLSGPYTFEPTHWRTTRDIFATARTINEPRPIAHVGPHVPPALLIHGGDDAVVEPASTIELARAWSGAGRPVSAEILPRHDHRRVVKAFARPYRYRSPLLAKVVAFVREIA